MIEAEPTLLTHLFELDRARMHLIALAYAHLHQVLPDLGTFLVSGTVRAITEKILGYYPTSIKRVLCHLPLSVLTPLNYSRLIALLADRKTAKLLHHAPSIDDFIIEALHGLPSALRNSVILSAFGRNDWINGFSEGLRLLASLGAASSFDALVGELALVSQPGQLFAKLRDILEALPLLPASLQSSSAGIAVVNALLQPIGFATSFLIVASLFAMMFKWLSDAKVAWGDVWLGAKTRIQSIGAGIASTFATTTVEQELMGEQGSAMRRKLQDALLLGAIGLARRQRGSYVLCAVLRVIGRVLSFSPIPTAAFFTASGVRPCCTGCYRSRRPRLSRANAAR